MFSTEEKKAKESEHKRRVTFGDMSSSGGLGLGALEEEEATDSFYTQSDRDQYDIEEGPSRRKKGEKRAKEEVEPLEFERADKPLTVGAGPVMSVVSGRPTAVPTREAAFPRLQVPQSFNCVHRFSNSGSDIDLSRDEELSKFASVYARRMAEKLAAARTGKTRSTLTAEDRGRLLGARQLPGRPGAKPSDQQGGLQPGPGGQRGQSQGMTGRGGRSSVYGMMSDSERKRLGDSLEKAFTTGTDEPSQSSKPSKRQIVLPDGSIDHRAAATLNMFGKLTRDEEDWKPERLLCKRFGVTDPFGPKTGRVFEPKRSKTGSQVPDAVLCVDGLILSVVEVQGNDGLPRPRAHHWTHSRGTQCQEGRRAATRATSEVSRRQCTSAGT